MGIYTIYTDPNIDRQINSQLNLIKKMILDNISEVNSIILTGGFGRGEGSVIITKNNKVIPLKDYDIIVIVNKIPSKEIKNKLYDSIYKKFGMENAENKLFRFSRFVIDIDFETKDSIASVDISDYELKVTSHLLYGEDIRYLNPWDIKDIPLYSGLRLLFEKVTGLIGHFSYYYTKGARIDEYKQELIIYECNKTFVEIATALCLLMKRYRPTYLERMINFSKYYKTDLPDLYNKLPDLSEKIILATKFKLKPDFNAIKEDPLNLWFITRYYLGIVIKYYIEKFLNITFSDWLEFPDKARLNMWLYYFRPLLKGYIQRKTGVKNERVVSISNFLAQLIINLEYIYRILKQNNILYLIPLFRPQAPAIKFFLAAPLILFSINKNGYLNEDYINKAINELKYCIPLNNNNFKGSKWDFLREKYLKAYNFNRRYF